MRALLQPASVAVIGASGDPEGIGGRPLALLQQRHFPGALYVVNPRRPEVAGLRSYPSVDDLPEPVDLAIVVSPAATVPGVLRQCARRGIGAAYVLSSGFAESSEESARALEVDIAAVVAATGLRVAGPNGEGVYNVAADFVIGFSPTVDLERGLEAPPNAGNVAVVAQSGGLGFGIFHRGLARGIGFSHVITTGNEVDLETLDFVDHLLGDAGTEVIVLFVEGFKHPDRVAATARRALEAGKPLVVAKVGRSEAAGRAAISHTGHLAGPSHLYHAVFKRYGVVEVDDVDELLDVTAALSAWGSARSGGRVGIVTMSGGAGAWLADACDTAGLTIPVLEPDRQAAILEGLPSYAAAANPVDLTAGFGGPEVAARVLRTVAGSPTVDVVMVALSMLGESFADRWAPFQAALDAEAKPVLVFSYTEPSATSRSALAASGYPWFCGQRGAALAARALCDFGRARAAGTGPPAGAGVEVTPLPDPTSDADVITEHAAKLWLAGLGLPVPAGRLVTTATDAVAAAHAIGGPVAMKIQSAAVPHKSEVGGLALDVSSPEEVAASFWRLDGAARARWPHVEGVLVEAMVAPGFEMMVGLLTDPDLGPFVLVGRGGTAAEMDPDTTVAPAPVSQDEARDLVTGLRCAPRLLGARGGEPMDVDALCSIVVGISWAGAQLGPALRELDLNPVIVHPAGHGAHIVDALVVRAGARSVRPGPTMTPSPSWQARTR